MTAKRGNDLLAIHQGQIITLADVVERVELDHQVVENIHRGFDEGDTVVPRIDVQEDGPERYVRVVAQFHELVQRVNLETQRTRRKAKEHRGR